MKQITYRFVVFQTILILVSLFAADNRTSERLWLFVRKNGGRIRNTSKQLLLPNTSRDLTVGSILSVRKFKVRVLRRGLETPIRAEQTFGGLINAEVHHIIIITESREVCLVLHRAVVLHGQVSETTDHAFLEFSRGTGARRVWSVTELFL